MFKYIILFIFLTLPIHAPAQITNVGFGYYGIQSKNWNCDESFAALDGVNNIHIAFLYKTFGLKNACLFRFVQDPRFRSLEIHLTNGAGLRKAVPRWYELLAGNGYTRGSLEQALLNKDRATFRLFKRELAIVNEKILSKLRPDQACFVSPILEHDLSPTAFDNLARVLRKTLLPGCLIVDSPNGSYEGGNEADLLERHGCPVLGCGYCINNIDGADISFDFRSGIPGAIDEHDLPEFIRNHVVDVQNFLWIREYNGYAYASLNAANEDPRDRTNFPDRQLFTAVANYVNWAETQFQVPKITRKNKKSFQNCTSTSTTLPSGFEMYRDEYYLTTVKFPPQFVQQFETVEVYYNGDSIKSLTFLNNYSGKQTWTADVVPYDFPYHIVIHAKSLNSSTDECFYVKNPKKNVRRK